MLHDRDQQDQGKGTVQGRDQAAEARLAEHGEIDRGERNTGHQIRDEDQLLDHVAVPFAAAAGRDVAEELSEDRRDQGSDQGKFDRIAERSCELGVFEQAVLVEGRVRGALQLTDPGVEGQVVGTVARAGNDLEGFHDQEEHRHDHGDDQEHGNDDQHRVFGAAQRDQVAAGALAADGRVGFARADQLLVHDDGAGCKQDHEKAHRVADALRAVVDEVFHPGRKHVERRAVRIVAAESCRHAVGPDRFADGHDRGRQDRREDQRQRDAL